MSIFFKNSDLIHAGEFCGKLRPPQLISSSNTMVVRFKSNHCFISKGFKPTTKNSSCSDWQHSQRPPIVLLCSCQESQETFPASAILGTTTTAWKISWWSMWSLIRWQLHCPAICQSSVLYWITEATDTVKLKFEPQNNYDSFFQDELLAGLYWLEAFQFCVRAARCRTSCFSRWSICGLRTFLLASTHFASETMSHFKSHWWSSVNFLIILTTGQRVKCLNNP